MTFFFDRYPSGKNREIPNFTSDGNDELHESNDSIKKDKHTIPNKGSISVASKLVSQLSNGAPPPSYRHGVVPK